MNGNKQSKRVSFFSHGTHSIYKAFYKTRVFRLVRTA